MSLFQHSWKELLLFCLSFALETWTFQPQNMSHNLLTHGHYPCKQPRWMHESAFSYPRWCCQQVASVSQPNCFGLSDEMSLGQIACRVVFDLTLKPFPAFWMSLALCFPSACRLRYNFLFEFQFIMIFCVRTKFSEASILVSLAISQACS